MSRFLDASSILRYVTQDDPVKAEAVRKLIDHERTLYVTTLTLAEVAWVLQTSTYRLPRTDVCAALLALLQERSIDVHDVSRGRVVQAVRLCQTRSVSFPDAFLWAQAADVGASVVTYDRKFPSDGISLEEPKG